MFDLFGSWHAVARVGDLAPGDVIAVAIDDLRLALGLDGERYFATQRDCAHRGADLSAGIISRGHLLCPQHGWRFSTQTGKEPGPLGLCLKTYPVRVVGDQIEIRDRPNKSAGDTP